jgi:hypothetical protein
MPVGQTCTQMPQSMQAPLLAACWRAREAAEQPAGQRRDEKQGGGGEDQPEGEEQCILRPEHEAEEVELFMGDVEEDGLAGDAVALPVQPAGAVEDDLGKTDHGPAQAVEFAVDGLGVDFSLLAVKLELRFANLADWLVHAGAPDL